LYLTDVHSQEARRRMHDAPPTTLTPLHRAEWAHALGQHQFRGDVTVETAQSAQAQFLSDQAQNLWIGTPLPENAFELCADLARRHGAKLGMRTLDTLHVACAMELKAKEFWTFDERQAKLAKAQGLKVS
jgi:predicted nucleic acid-binding protein